MWSRLTGIEKNSARYFKIAACCERKLVLSIKLFPPVPLYSFLTSEAIESTIIKFIFFDIISSSREISLQEKYGNVLSNLDPLYIWASYASNELKASMNLNCLTSQTMNLKEILFKDFNQTCLSTRLHRHFVPLQPSLRQPEQYPN